MNALSFLKIIRWPNVLMTVVTQLVLIYGLFDTSGLSTALTDLQVALLISATALLTASGNVINDVYDVVIDQVNKPEQVIVGKKMTEKTAMNLYFALTVSGVGLGFLLANLLDKVLFSSVFIIVAFILYLYASQLKSMLLVGNIVISLLVSMVLFVTVIFDLLPEVTLEQQSSYQSLLLITTVYAGIAFVFNLCREWIKDCQDMNGDRAGGRSTLPLIMGKERTQKLTTALLILGNIGITYLLIKVLYRDTVLVYYLVLGVFSPLLYIALRLWQAKSQKELSTLSTILKVVMLVGVFSLLLIARNSWNA